ncbi:hypothetical protein CASFOL_019549 [Castilleja foliolosa]|uniref:Uncharacterized protein n=1 Tax=Castilleja foliolosa TaxID=1961234 RepID=A0ABD3D4P7_9LAMI
MPTWRFSLLVSLHVITIPRSISKPTRRRSPVDSDLQRGGGDGRRIAAAARARIWKTRICSGGESSNCSGAARARIWKTRICSGGESSDLEDSDLQRRRELGFAAAARARFGAEMGFPAGCEGDGDGGWEELGFQRRSEGGPSTVAVGAGLSGGGRRIAAAARAPI